MSDGAGPGSGAGDAGGIDFLPFTDLAGSVRQDVEAIRGSAFVPGDLPVSGYIYDVGTGALETVVPADSSTPARPAGGGA